MVDEYTTSGNKKRDVPHEDESVTDAAAEILGTMIHNNNLVQPPPFEMLPLDCANQESSSSASSKRSRKEPTKQWMAYSGARHTRVGNDFQVALLPSPSPVAASTSTTNTPTTVSLAASPVHETTDVVDTTTAASTLQEEEDDDEEENMDENDEKGLHDETP
jgi:hypothetical protein